MSSATSYSDVETKPKSKKRSNALNQLLADSDWYMTEDTGHRPRNTGYRSIANRERALNQYETKRKSHVHVLTEEQKAERRARDAERRRIKQQKIDERKEKERLRREKLKKDRAEGKIPEPKKKQTTYYSGREVDLLMNATQFFTNVDHEFQEKREVKPVERWTPEMPLTRHSTKVKHKTLKRIVLVKKEEKPKKHKKKKARKTSSVSTPQAETPVAEEPETPEEPQSTWFSDLTSENVTAIEKGRKLFVPSVYDLKEDDSIPVGLVQAYDLVMANEKSYHIGDGEYQSQEVLLQYPFSPYKERYMLAVSRHDTGFNPYDELGRVMELIAFSYMPLEERKKVINLDNPTDCIVGRYITAFEHMDFQGLLSTINEFNSLVNELRQSKQMMIYARSRETFPTVMIYEIMNLCYARTVMPEARKLRSYKAFSNLVYGELMPTFLSKVYAQCGLHEKSCFIDLGSGVGNCVIQAAVEFGCPSYGVEIAEGASDLGDLQAGEFEKRCKVLGLSHGTIHLFSRQSFTDNKPVKDVVDRCDVILCNNYLFDAQLNAKVVDLFANLKVGTKIISLKPIVPPGYTVSWENAGSILSRLKTSRYIYEEGSVSWTSNGGFYFITEVKEDIVDDNFVIFQSRSRRNENLGGPRSRSATPLNAFTNNV